MEFQKHSNSVSKSHVIVYTVIFVAGYLFGNFLGDAQVSNVQVTASLDGRHGTELEKTSDDVQTDGEERLDVLFGETMYPGFDPKNKFLSADSNVELNILEDIDARMTLSMQKTGTTAFEWIVQAIFKNFAIEVESNPQKYGDYDVPLVTLSKDTKLHTLTYRGKTVTFDSHGKHDNSGLKPNVNLKVRMTGRACAKSNTAAWTNECMNKVAGLRKFTNHTLQKSWRTPSKRNKWFTTFRNPISTVISNVYYVNSNTNFDSLSAVILEKEMCHSAAASVSLMHRFVTEVLPPLGYQIYPVYFDEMRLYPEAFVRKIASQLGITVNDAIVKRTVQETSPEYMKQVQEGKVGDRNEYHGLSNSGKNSRKVRKANVKGYLTELKPEALKQCTSACAFHLPPILRERYGF